jgi:hypothetical protein
MPNNSAQFSSMNSTTSKRFHVIITDCENRSHADKIAELLYAFPYAEYREADKPSIGFSMKVEADSRASIQAAIASALGKAKAEINEHSAWAGEPPPYTQFKPPRKPR